MSIVSDRTSSVDSEGEGPAVTEKEVERSPPGKKSQYRIPKKIHKAEREKLKRDHLNDLFHDLGLALEPNRQNNGKASILSDASRLLRDLLARVEALRRENAALVTESRYVTAEKNELRDENTALEAEIQKLQDELRERVQMSPAWGNTADASPVATALTLQAPPRVVGPVYVIPLNQELPTHNPETAHASSPPKPPPHVTRPHARYPTPSDSWPLQILSQHPRTDGEDGGQHSGGGSNISDGDARWRSA